MIQKVDIGEAAEALKKGEVLIIPTETVYGIAADATNKSAVTRIYEIKGRSFDKPLQLMVANLKMAEEFLLFNHKAKSIAEKFLPGALTMVLEKKPDTNLVKEINLKDNSIGLRIPDHDVLLKLLNTIDFPIVATSANISGATDPINVDEAINNLAERNIKFALDGGKCSISKPSTVADFRDGDIKILRQGSVEL